MDTKFERFNNYGLKLGNPVKSINIGAWVKRGKKNSLINQIFLFFSLEREMLFINNLCLCFHLC